MTLRIKYYVYKILNKLRKNKKYINDRFIY